jgi:Xaa-Pro dipeptidase
VASGGAVIDVQAVQAALAERNLDAWLLYDFRGQNSIARRLAGVAPERLTTRRWFWLLPREGEPVALVSALEASALDVPGRHVVCRGWRDLEAALREALAGRRSVAMEVSPLAAVPYVGRVDWGTVELVRSLGVDVVSSGDLVQLFEARLTPLQKDLHDAAVEVVVAAKDAAFGHVRELLASGESLTESELLAFVGRRLRDGGLEADHAPIVAVDEHGASPHFETSAGADDRVIAAGAILLLDLWGKVAGEPDAVYADVTWMGFCGDEPPKPLLRAWVAVRDARDAAIAFAGDEVSAGRAVHGYDIDRAARSVLAQHGLGGHSLTRIGHSLGTELHGNGVNIDDLETRDERVLVPGLLFTVEPGLYFAGEFGVRTEVDVFVGERGVEVTTVAQRDLVLLT